jgi:hypothetical protein
MKAPAALLLLVAAGAHAFELADPAQAATSAGRVRLQYLVGCALPAGVVVTSGAHGFRGDIGLAPAWSRRALTADESRWVSACVLARTNSAGIEVAISMRGPRAELGVDAAEQAQFPLHEGAYFGDIFATPMKAYVCTGTADAATLRARQRRCSLGDCGFVVAGPCAQRPFEQDGVDYSRQVIDVYLPAGPGG